MIDVETSIPLWELIKHSKQWLVNLKRAKDDRKQNSTMALRKVLIAIRQTNTFLRHEIQNREFRFSMESDFSKSWTELGFELHDLGIMKLSERCLTIGGDWGGSTSVDEEIKEKMRSSLKEIEEMASEILKMENN